MRLTESDETEPYSEKFIKAFLVDPECPSRNTGGPSTPSPTVRELLELAHGREFGTVVHDGKRNAVLVCLNGIRSLEFFEGSLDALQKEICENFPLDTKGVLVKISPPDVDKNLPYTEVVRIANKYSLCDATGKPLRPLFRILQPIA